MESVTKYEQPLTILETLLLKYPDKDWNWYAISCNPNITMEFIKAHPEKYWNWHFISRNPNLTMEMIKASLM